MRYLLAPLLLFLAPLSAQAVNFPARVVGVSDGDTLTVLAVGNRQVRVRLQGVDAPETGQDFGSRAKQAASELAFGKDVTIREVNKDRYGRTVAEVILPDGRSLGRELIRQGMAWWMQRYASASRELAGLEAEAKAARRGLWSQANPTPPWEWRHPKMVWDGQVVGNRNSHVFHAPNCPSVARMKETNRVAFRTAAEAEAAGYRRAEDCR